MDTGRLCGSALESLMGMEMWAALLPHGSLSEGLDECTMFISSPAENGGHSTGGMMDRGVGDGMIIGIGTDLAEIERIEHSIVRFGDRFLSRIYTPGEIAYCMRKKRPGESFAARFAAKEAGAKALGTGIRRGVGWRELEVQRERSGRPRLVLHGRAAELAAALKVTSIALSLTHSGSSALAFVVLER